MKYEIYENKVRGMFWVFAVTKFGSELVRTFKTRKAAESWVARRG